MNTEPADQQLSGTRDSCLYDGNDWRPAKSELEQVKVDEFDMKRVRTFAFLGLLFVTVVHEPALFKAHAQVAPSLTAVCRKAEMGIVNAQVLLGDMYSRGNGVARDDAEATRWYRLAVEQGHAGAQNSLGIMYDQGRGVAADAAEAVRWYRIRSSLVSTSESRIPRVWM